MENDQKIHQNVENGMTPDQGKKDKGLPEALKNTVVQILSGYFVLWLAANYYLTGLFNEVEYMERVHVPYRKYLNDSYELFVTGALNWGDFFGTLTGLAMYLLMPALFFLIIFLPYLALTKIKEFRTGEKETGFIDSGLLTVQAVLTFVTCSLFIMPSLIVFSLVVGKSLGEKRAQNILSTIETINSDPGAVLQKNELKDQLRCFTLKGSTEIHFAAVVKESKEFVSVVSIQPNVEAQPVYTYRQQGISGDWQCTDTQIKKQFPSK